MARISTVSKIFELSQPFAVVCTDVCSAMNSTAPNSLRSELQSVVVVTCCRLNTEADLMRNSGMRPLFGRMTLFAAIAYALDISTFTNIVLKAESFRANHTEI